MGPVSPDAGFCGGYDFKRESASFGAQIRIPVGRALDLIPSGDYFFSGGDNHQFNIDAALRLGRIQALYLGGGVGFAEGDTGPSVLVGLEPGRRLPRRPVHGYLEARWTFTTNYTFQLLLGINVRLTAR